MGKKYEAMIEIKGDAKVLELILDDIVKHLNEKQDNFSMWTKGLNLE